MRGILGGDAFFAAKVLGARGTLLVVLAHFFDRGRWDSPVETGVEGQCLTAEDQLFVLMQAGEYLTATRGFATAEAQMCYRLVETLCQLLNSPLIPYPPPFNQPRSSPPPPKLP